MADNGVKDKLLADSPTSVLEDEDACKEDKGVKMEEELFLDAKNGDSSLISEAMAVEEEKLLEERVKKEEANEHKEVPILNDIQFTKLDELLTQTQLYSKFLLEKMDDITKNGLEDDDKSPKEKKRGRGSKRKAASDYNNVVPWSCNFPLQSSSSCFPLSPEVFIMSLVIWDVMAFILFISAKR